MKPWILDIGSLHAVLQPLRRAVREWRQKSEGSKTIPKSRPEVLLYHGKEDAHPGINSIDKKVHLR